MTSTVNGTLRLWQEGLLSNGEAIQHILLSSSDNHAKFEGIATIALKLVEQEEAKAEQAFIEANYFNFTEHVRAYYIKDLPTDNEPDHGWDCRCIDCNPPQDEF